MPGPTTTRPTAGPMLRRASDVAWRLLVIGLLAFVIGGLLWKLRIVALPILIAMLVSSVLAPLVVRLESRGWKTLPATLLVFFGFLFLVAGAVAAVVPATINEFEGLGDTIETALDDIEDWLVEGPVGLEREAVEEVTDDPGGALSDLVRDSSEHLASGARTAGEVAAGALLAVVLSFLFLKDGRRFQRWTLAHLPERHHDVVQTAGRRALAALAGFLRGAALLGLVEGVVIGLTLWLVGAPLAVPVAVFTFLAAFFPIVGAIVAGAIAVLVTLTSQGFGTALIVLAVVIVVQQLDGDLLAPWIYGRSLQLNPAVVLVALTVGGAMGGIAGAFVAVPVSGALGAILSTVWDEYGHRVTGEPVPTQAEADPAEG